MLPTQTPKDKFEISFFKGEKQKREENEKRMKNPWGEVHFQNPAQKMVQISNLALNTQTKSKLKKSKFAYLPKKHPFPHSWEAFALKAAKFDNF